MVLAQPPSKPNIAVPGMELSAIMCAVAVAISNLVI